LGKGNVQRKYGWENLKGGGHFGNIVIIWRIILNWILKEQSKRVFSGFS
jgi:hypothetical protein